MIERRRIQTDRRVVPTRRLIMGIDVGANGGLAVTEAGPNAIMLFKRMPESNDDLWAWLRQHCPNPTRTTVYIEAVHAYSMGAAGAFKFGMGYGRLLAFMTALDIKPVKVQPATWQRALNIPTTRKPEPADFRKQDGTVRTTKAVKAKLQAEHKEDIRQRAQQLMPNLKLWRMLKNDQMAMCDAVLICYYGKMCESIDANSR